MFFQEKYSVQDTLNLILPGPLSALTVSYLPFEASLFFAVSPGLDRGSLIVTDLQQAKEASFRCSPEDCCFHHVVVTEDDHGKWPHSLMMHWAAKKVLEEHKSNGGLKRIKLWEWSDYEIITHARCNKHDKRTKQWFSCKLKEEKKSKQIQEKHKMRNSGKRIHVFGQSINK